VGKRSDVLMINPAYRLLLQYSIRPNRHEMYYRYVRAEFVPLMHQLGLRMLAAWEVHGSYPERQLEFVCESEEVLRDALNSGRFERAENKLQTYIVDYQRKVVPYRNRFQM
jgi:hypothetical protein